jgi:hypothetical protein
VLRRNTIRHAQLLKRKHALELECNLSSLLRIGRENLSTVEQEVVHKLAYALEQLASNERTTSSELGTWKLVHAPSKSSLLKRVLKRQTPATEENIQRLTYLSNHLKIGRGSDGSLFIYTRVSSPDPCKECEKPFGSWAWPL